MKKFILTAISIGVFTVFVSGQQIENPGFETWEDAGTVIDEPVNWSSIKTSDAGSLINIAAPVVWGQSVDAHTGNFSLELTNVLTIGSIVATGMTTNGRVHADFIPENGYTYTDPADPRWHTPLTGRPDSVAAWVKYFPEGSDTAQLKVLLHVGEGTMPITPENQVNRIGYAQINVSGLHDTWTRVVVPFTYFSQVNPEYILMTLTSGAGYFPIEGSVVLVDDLELIYDPSGVGVLSHGKSLIYTFGMTISLDKMPEDQLKGANMELINLNGSRIFSTKLSSTHVNVDGTGILKGFYIVRITGEKGVYSQKIQLR